MGLVYILTNTPPPTRVRVLLRKQNTHTHTLFIIGLVFSNCSSAMVHSSCTAVVVQLVVCGNIFFSAKI